jgi:SAM-dependent methyltransferase
VREPEGGQVTRGAAEVYDRCFVPALFREWAGRVADAAEVQTGQRVLDVACGTGALACLAATRVGPSGSVTGLDLNEQMLAVARRKAPAIGWCRGTAEALPFRPGAFDVVASQFGLMFVEHPRLALEQMWRVLRPGGRLAVAVWDLLENSPGYAALADLVERFFGEAAADTLRVPCNLGSTALLSSLLTEAGISGARIATLEGMVRFPSLSSWLHAEVRGWVLSDRLDEGQFARLLSEAQARLRLFTLADGRVEFAAPAHIVLSTRPS